jgi:hypothetical protein
MPSTYTSGLRIERPGQGDYLNNWGPVIDNIFDMVDDSVTGVTTVTTVGGTVSLSMINGNADEARRPVLNVVGALAGPAIVIVPNTPHLYHVINGTTGSFSLTIKAGTGLTSAVVPQGKSASLFADGANNVVYRAPAVNQLGAIDPGSLPIATVFSTGVVQIATDPVAAAGTDSSVVITAKQLGAAATAASSAGTTAAAAAQTTANTALIAANAAPVVWPAAAAAPAGAKVGDEYYNTVDEAYMKLVNDGVSQFWLEM